MWLKIEWGDATDKWGLFVSEKYTREKDWWAKILATNAEDEQIEQIVRNVKNCHSREYPRWKRWTDEPRNMFQMAKRGYYPMIKNGDEIMRKKVWKWPKSVYEIWSNDGSKKLRHKRMFAGYWLYLE